MKKLTIILVFVLLFSGIVSASYQELPVDYYSHIPVEGFVERAERVGWEIGGNFFIKNLN